MCSQQRRVVSDNRAKHQSVAVFGHREATLPEDFQTLRLLRQAKKKTCDWRCASAAQLCRLTTGVARAAIILHRKDAAASSDSAIISDTLSMRFIKIQRKATEHFNRTK